MPRLKPDEILSILHKNERVLNEQQTSAFDSSIASQLGPQFQAPSQPAQALQSIQVEVPEIKLEAPEISIPELKIKAPEITVPEAPVINAPKLEAPEIDALIAEAPQFEVPKLEAPEIPELRLTVPRIEAPDLRIEAPEVRLTVPRIEAPDLRLDAPRIEMPDVRMPEFDQSRMEFPDPNAVEPAFVRPRASVSAGGSAGSPTPSKTVVIQRMQTSFVLPNATDARGLKSNRHAVAALMGDVMREAQQKVN